MRNDFTIELNRDKRIYVHDKEYDDEWMITFADTGAKAQTGARIKRIEKHIADDYFLATYGDGVGNIDIGALVDFHRKQKTIGTLTAVHPHSKWGLIKAGANNIIEEFVEKPILFDYVNGGFYVFNKQFFDYLSADDDCVLESKPFEQLVAEKELSIFKHEGYWHAMDTYKDYLELNRVWGSGNCPWKVWR